MKNIINIAKNTFKEAIRDRILIVIIAFSLLFLLSTILFGSISLGEDIKVIKDLGLAGIYIFSLIITIFLGSSLIYKEIEKRTLYIMLSKPVSRTQFIIGKFFGLWLSIIFSVIIMTIVYLLTVYVKSKSIDLLSLWSILLQLFELAIFIGIAILFSTVTTPLAGTIYSIIILYIGHSVDILKKSADKSGVIAKFFSNSVYYILPNLEKFNIRNSVVHGVIPNSAEIIYPIIYSSMYVLVLLWLAILALRKQEL